MSGVLRRLVRGRPLARVALNLAPRRGPYGGGNQFVLQLERALRRLGFEVQHELRGSTDLVLVVEARDELARFGIAEIARWRERRPDGVVVHRVNECDQRKGTATMDGALARANGVADHTVFVSSWLRHHHAQRWFDASRPNSVVLPGADPRAFHPLGGRLPDPHQPFRLVTHHWSDHPMKGFAVYAQIDAAIAEGRLPGCQLTLIGRWPETIGWRAARLQPPLAGERLGAALRSAHAYVTASLWEPGAMHVAEALQCGLPVAYHEDGGGLVEQATHGGVPFRDDVVAAVLALRRDHEALRRAVLQHAPSGEQMSLEYVRLFQRLLAERAARA